MLQYLVTWVRALKGEEGQDLAEYALLIALIAVALVFVIGFLSGTMAGIFNQISNYLANAPSQQY